MAIPSIPDPYRALGLTPEATAAEIRSAYKKLMLKCHPDKVHDESQKEEKAQQYEKVMTAYELLSDPKKKRRYDLDLQRHTSSENRPTNGTATTDTTTKAEARDTSEEGRKEKSRERQRHESTRQARREYESEEYVKTRDMPKRDVPKEEEMRREKEASRERDVPKGREVPTPKERDVPRETPIRESDATREVPREMPRETESREKESSKDRNRPNKESSRDRDRSHKDHKEPREYQYKEAREHKHSRESSKEKDRKHNIRSETSPPPAPDTYSAHQQKYQEEKRLEEEKLKKARESMGIYTERSNSSQERARRREEDERERHEREKRRFAYEEELRKVREVRERMHVHNAEEHDGFNMEDLYSKPTESRRGSTQKREPSPKDSPPSSRERKSSHSPSHRGGSNSPVRGEQLHSSSGRPLRTPYGSAPPPAAGSTFAPFSPAPRRRHSVSSQDPTKATRLYPQDSGYSSPNHPGTPMGPDGRIPPLMRSSTESGERNPGWFGVYGEPEGVTGYTSIPMPGHMHRRKTTSHHPLGSDLTSAPIQPSEFRKPAPVTSASSASTAYYYPSHTSPYYASPTHAPHHYSSGSSSVHPQQSPTRSHSTRHSSSHNHSVSPHGSPKVAQEGFLSMNDIRSPTMSGASTVHHTPGYHYGRTEYFSPPPVSTRHTI